MILHGYDLDATSRLSESFQQLQRESAGKLGLGHVHKPSATLLRYIDRALDAVIAWDGAQAPRFLLQLVGIRRGLFADAAPYRSTPKPGDAASAIAERLAA